MPSEKPKRTTRAIGYVRVSTTGQARDGVSMDFQREAIEKYARVHELELLEILSEPKGVSGKALGNRPHLLKAVEIACDRGAALCVYSLSRASRKTRDLLELQETIDRYGAEIISVTENVDTRTSAGRQYFRTMASFAEFERDLIMERCAEGFAECRRQGRRLGRPDRPPYGYRLAEGDPGRLVQDMSETRRLALIRRMIKDRYKWRQIARYLNVNRMMRRNGKPWTGRDVADVAKSTARRDAAVKAAMDAVR